MSQAISDLTQLLCTMEPTLNPSVYVYSSVPFDADLGKFNPIATFREKEGITIITDEKSAKDANLKILFRAAWITLTVHSNLAAIGLTAAFSTALGKSNISCNVVAGAFHDHIFVPVESALIAMNVLKQLQTEASSIQSNSHC